MICDICNFDMGDGGFTIIVNGFSICFCLECYASGKLTEREKEFEEMIKQIQGRKRNKENKMDEKTVYAVCIQLCDFMRPACQDIQAQIERIYKPVLDKSLKIKRIDFKDDKWPFTVSNGELIQPKPNAAVFRHGDTMYALNGIAMAHGCYEDLEPIWRDHPTIKGLKISISDMIQKALEKKYE